LIEGLIEVLAERREDFFVFGACLVLAATGFGCLGFAATLPQDLRFGFFASLRVIFGMIVYT
jgi:hypothetical protein